VSKRHFAQRKKKSVFQKSLADEPPLFTFKEIATSTAQGMGNSRWRLDLVPKGRVDQLTDLTKNPYLI
jgi:hypothetical protein